VMTRRAFQPGLAKLVECLDRSQLGKRRRADIKWQAKAAGSVESDPKRTLRKAGTSASRQRRTCQLVIRCLRRVMLEPNESLTRISRAELLATVQEKLPALA
jgi:hypothetical protein